MYDCPYYSWNCITISLLEHIIGTVGLVCKSKLSFFIGTVTWNITISSLEQLHCMTKLFLQV